MKKLALCILCLCVWLTACEDEEYDTFTESVSERGTTISEETKVPEDTEALPEQKIEISDNDEEEMTEEQALPPEDNTTKSVLSGKVIVIDAGHGINSYNKQEAIAPNSTQTKDAFASGTRGTNLTEEELNLEVALKLEDVLAEKGAKVYMTRNGHKSDMTNIDRAEFANELVADISVKIHADGNNNSSVCGASVLVPGTAYITDSEVIAKSRAAGEYILSEYVLKTGMNSRGISVRNDLTGFNWSKVPIVLVEMGFMTNPKDDEFMETKANQEKMVEGIVSGLEKYFAADN